MLILGVKLIIAVEDAQSVNMTCDCKPAKPSNPLSGNTEAAYRRMAGKTGSTTEQTENVVRGVAVLEMSSVEVCALQTRCIPHI
jgi:hypothetical protein